MTLINLNNQEMELRYDLNSICEFEDKSGKGLFAMLNENNLGFNLIRLLVWAGLRHKNKMLTVEIVGLWLNDSFKNGLAFDDVFQKVMKSLQDSGLIGKLEEENINNKDDEFKKNLVT